LAEDTIFAKIARGEMDADIVYEDDDCVAFRDIDPKAPTHVLVIPRETVSGLDDPKATPDMLGHLAHVCTKVAEKLGIAGDGYRVVVNVGRNGGQSVSHLHFHVLGGRPMTWPPG
jgi:histidine triad (HIT) family protein